MQVPPFLRTAAFSLLFTCACATAALAQAPNTTSPRADALFQRAEAMGIQTSTSFSDHKRRTAELYLKSAELRAYGDPRKVESLRRAAGLLIRVDPRRSQELFERAGDTALAVEDLFLAANLYTDAAWVVAEDPFRMPELIQAAVDCLELARQLVEASAVTVEQRALVLRRIESAAVIVAAHGLSTT